MAGQEFTIGAAAIGRFCQLGEMASRSGSHSGRRMRRRLGAPIAQRAAIRAGER
jgi:hypothetical protein